MFGLQIFQNGWALLVLMSVLSISSCMAQPPGPPPPPPPPREGLAPPPPPPAALDSSHASVSGVVRNFNYGPGGLDGLVLDRGQIIHFPLEYANRVAALAPIGSSISVSGWPHTGPAGDMIFDANSLTNQRTGASLAVTNGPPPPPAPGPPGPGRGPAPPPPPPAPASWPAPLQPPVGPAGAFTSAAGPSAAPAVASLSGTIRSFNYGVDGQINGLILSDGTTVYFPPELGSQIAAAVQIGGRVAVTGWPRTGPAGNRLIDAQTITNRRTGATVTTTNSAPPPGP